MRVLMLHNTYRQFGGEDSVVRSEAALLRDEGVLVQEMGADNAAAGFGALTRLGWHSDWSQASYERVLQACRDFRPDIVHVHNFWLRLTPSVHAAAHAGGAATVQTLHNFRLLCPNALFLRDSMGCEDCLGKIPWRGVLRRCYRDSFLASAGVARMIVSNRRRHTWDRDVDAFILLSEAARGKFIAGGLPADKLFLKANFVADPGEVRVPPSACHTVLFAGRLAHEKGVDLLLTAWHRGELWKSGELLIAGDGPEMPALRAQADSLGLQRVTFLGQQDPAEIARLLARARVVALPSIWFEQFPCTVVEAFAHGRPMVVSDVGALNELVQNAVTGLRFAAGNPESLALELKSMLTDDALADRLGARARIEYLNRYTPARNFDTLMGIYEAALDRRSARLPKPVTLSA